MLLRLCACLLRGVFRDPVHLRPCGQALKQQACSRLCACLLHGVPGGLVLLVLAAACWCCGRTPECARVQLPVWVARPASATTNCGGNRGVQNGVSGAFGLCKVQSMLALGEQCLHGPLCLQLMDHSLLCILVLKVHITMLMESKLYQVQSVLARRQAVPVWVVTYRSMGFNNRGAINSLCIHIAPQSLLLTPTMALPLTLAQSGTVHEHAILPSILKQ